MAAFLETLAIPAALVVGFSPEALVVRLAAFLLGCPRAPAAEFLVAAASRPLAAAFLARCLHQVVEGLTLSKDREVWLHLRGVSSVPHQEAADMPMIS